jgi:hypothetical protein
LVIDRSIGYLLGGIVAVLSLVAIFMLFGSMLVGIVSAIIAFPLAAPLTTAALLIVLIFAGILYRWKR